MLVTYVVELTVFAGASNPRFVLTADEAGELRQLVHALTDVVAARAQPRLGYRGLVVYAHGPRGAWQPWLSVADGVATVVRGSGAGLSYRADALEQHLLHTAADHGLGDVLKQAGSEPFSE